MGFRCGIVGLSNVGKSTLFNALTATASAQASSYPFSTIEPNIGEVMVPDGRLDTLARLARSAKIKPARLGFVDIAGLVRGASRGEGLGNQFLSHVREVDAIAGGTGPTHRAADGKRGSLLVDGALGTLVDDRLQERVQHVPRQQYGTRPGDRRLGQGSVARPLRQDAEPRLELEVLDGAPVAVVVRRVVEERQLSRTACWVSIHCSARALRASGARPLLSMGGPMRTVT